MLINLNPHNEWARVTQEIMQKKCFGMSKTDTDAIANN